MARGVFDGAVRSGNSASAQSVASTQSSTSGLAQEPATAWVNGRHQGRHDENLRGRAREAMELAHQEIEAVYTAAEILTLELKKVVGR